MTNIRTSIEGPVGFITIDRKERFNSLDVDTARDLRKAGLQMSRADAIRVVVLQGIEGVFCSGADLKYIRAGGKTEDVGYLLPNVATGFSPSQGGLKPASTSGYGELFKQILEYIHSTISEIRRAPKPFIAAIDGIAAAGGFGLAMACDLVIASDRSTFEWAYSKTGLTGAESSTFFLPRLLGLRKAMEMLFLNPRLNAKAALDMGLITAVVPQSHFDVGVRALAEQLAKLPTEAVGIAKNLMNEAAGIDRLDYHLDRELAQLARIADGANFAEGIDAFFDKRQPEFKER